MFVTRLVKGANLFIHWEMNSVTAFKWLWLLVLIGQRCQEISGQEEAALCQDGVEFLLVNNLVQYADAILSCESRNGVLAAIANDAEYNQLVSLAEESNFGRDIWLGKEFLLV